MKKWPFKRGSFHMNSFMKGQEKGDLLIQVSGFLRVLRFPRANKTVRHDVTEILLKVALDTIILTPNPKMKNYPSICILLPPII